jgi:hypothetical protein
MAVAVSKPTVDARVNDVRSLRSRVYDVTFSGNYTANGEVVEAADVGLKTIVQVHAPGVATDDNADPATGNPVAVIVADDGSTATFVLFDSAADGDPLDEKPAEAVVGVGPLRCTFIGW